MDESCSMVNKTFRIELPWPPTVNHYWGRRNVTTYITERGMTFRKNVQALTYEYRGFFDADVKLHMTIAAYPPDKRRRDLDNLLKSLCDSLQHAGIYHDDNQIDRLYIERMPAKSSLVIVEITAI